MPTAQATHAQAEHVAAWNDYLNAIRSITSDWRYDEVEEWAWARLQQRLRQLELG